MQGKTRIIRADEFAGALDQHNQSEEKEKGDSDPDRGLNHLPEDDQKRDRRDTNDQYSKPIHHALSASRSLLGVFPVAITQGSIGL
jgi:hypothetical protein